MPTRVVAQWRHPMKRADYPNEQDEHTPVPQGCEDLWRACCCNDAATVARLLAEGVPVNVHNPVQMQCFALMYAAGHNAPECVRILLQAGADIDARDEYGTTALYWAAAHNHAECVRLLLEAGAGTGDEESSNPLPIASEQDCRESVRLLLEHGADPNADCPLCDACREDNREIAEMLIQAGARLHAMGSNGSTPMSSMAWSRDYACKELFHASLTRDPQEWRDICTLMEVTNDNTLWCWKENREKMDMAALARAAALLARHAEGEAVVLRASCHNFHELLKLFLDAGADPNCRSHYGTTPLMLAAMNNQSESVRLLLDAGADVNLVDSFGETALICASHALTDTDTDTACIEMLLKAGADPFVKNKEGKTAYDVALELEKDTSAELLKAAMES